MDYVEERLRELKEKSAPTLARRTSTGRRRPLSDLSFAGVHKVKMKLRTGEEKIYFYAWRGGPRLHGETEAELRASFSKIVASRIKKAERKKLAPKPATIESACRALSNNIRARALKSGHGFYLPWQEIYRMGEEQKWLCAVTGIAFDLSYEQAANFTYNPFGMSADRIKCSMGYEPKNVRLVLTAVNFALNDWGDEIFLRIARAAVDKANSVK